MNVDNIFRSTSPESYRTGQGVAGGSAELLTAANYGDLRRGVFVQNLTERPIFIGNEGVSTENGFVLQGGAGHLFPVSESGRLFVVGEPDYELNRFTWYAL